MVDRELDGSRVLYHKGRGVYDAEMAVRLQESKPEEPLDLDVDDLFQPGTHQRAKDLFGECMENDNFKRAVEYFQSRCTPGRVGKPCPGGKVKILFRPRAPQRDVYAMYKCSGCLIELYVDTFDSLADERKRDKCAILAHELIHLGDMCAIGSCSGAGDCENWLCAEARANHVSCCMLASLSKPHPLACDSVSGCMDAAFKWYMDYAATRVCRGKQGPDWENWAGTVWERCSGGLKCGEAVPVFPSLQPETK
jgi:hypothetical protein